MPVQNSLSEADSHVSEVPALDDIFSAAIELSAPEERAAYIQQACGGDEQLFKKVQKLVVAYLQAGNFLESPASIMAPKADGAIQEAPGTTIGRYKLLEQIGEGGFALVFMAEQDKPVRRKVALKIVKAGMDTKQIVARFEAERQALAMMDHPSIAKVHDAGSTDAGRPYFVMELVKGVPITDYCTEHDLSLDQRVQLFLQVCQAVQHAHQKGIIHRDLKPTNVLVCTHDGQPMAKVIDFGIAKATQTPLTDKTLFTDFRQLIGTPAYMSPEQVEGSLDIDTRSDVYSLGALLYALLVGVPPFDPKELRSKTFSELQRTIREVEPPLPSKRIATGTAAAILAKSLQGELDWIVMRALDKDRNRRYQSADALADDLNRYLLNQPVEARRPTRRYRLRKFIRRNQWGVLAGAGIGLALLIGISLASIGFVRARKEATLSDQVAQFLKDTLKAAGPAVSRGRDATLLKEILDQTANRIEKELKDQPEVQGDLWRTLGQTYADIGDKERAIVMEQRAVDCYRQALGKSSPKLALALTKLGAAQSFTGKVTDGKANAMVGLEMARKCADQATLASCLYCVAQSFASWGLTSYEGAPYVRESLAIQEKLKKSPLAIADCQHWLAGCLDSDDAESLARQSLATYQLQLEPDHPKIAGGFLILGEVLLQRDKSKEAEDALRQTYELYCKIHDQKHPYRKVVSRFFAQSLVENGKIDEAEALATKEDSFLLPGLSAAQNDWRVTAERCVVPDDIDIAVRRKLLASRAIALALAGRLDESRRACADGLQRTRSWEAASAALAVPVTSDDRKEAFIIADGIDPKYEKSASLALFVKSLAALRRGQFELSNQKAQQALDLEDATVIKARAWSIQAISLVNEGKLDQARRLLTQVDKLFQKPSKYDYLNNWCDWALAELLRNEAAALIQESAPPEQP